MKEKQLFLVKTRGCGEFYVVAGSFDQAADLVRNELGNQGYGYSGDQEVVSVQFLCRQHFFNGKRFLSGDNGENNLFVWGDGDENK
ncbi:MAG: hypothetical protein IJ557_02545 [Bacteroidaceae bacterium]|nr:hypothetical protein [Bacteroidaceae bacterium]